MGISERLWEVTRRVENAQRASGRGQPCAVRLVAVSKGQPVERIEEAYAAGQRDFGENYAQELAEKAERLSALRGICWHMIGHVQTNKAKVVVQHAQVVQTVDSVRLAVELARRAEQRGRRLPVLIEVNVGGEASKSGIRECELEPLVRRIAEQPALEHRGLMTVPPYEADVHEARRWFLRLRELREAGWGGAGELSMGMSHDFEVAIGCGATMVRVGTAIFGPRGGL